jgi:FlaA1/EpsC-like NDP-sugar epimerase
MIFSTEHIKNFFDGKKILITGGAGSIGKEIVKELLKYEPDVIRVLDVSENGLFMLEKDIGVNSRLRFLLGDVRDKNRLIRAMQDIDYVFHTAALKHVLICEYNPFEAVQTNVHGTQNVIDAAIECNVDKVIFTSSDKAVNPNNTMGASKLLAEKLIIAANFYRGPKVRTKFSCVRFGNILGSSGSVLPLFKEQIKNGGPITVTHKEMNRFVLTQKDAMDFLIESMILSRGGEIFVPKMPVVSILDLVDVLLSEYAPQVGQKATNIEIKYIGIKSGEKLYEEMMTEDEASRCVLVDWIYVILPQFDEFFELEPSIYPRAKPFDGIKLKSRDHKPVKKEEIKKILVENNLI